MKNYLGNIVNLINIIINKKNLLPEEQNYYNEKNIKMRTLFFKKNKIFNDNLRPSVLEMVSHHKKNSRTIIEYQDLYFNINLDEKYCQDLLNTK